MDLYVYTSKSFVYMISQVHIDFLTLPHGLLYSSDLPYDVTSYGYISIYLTFYGLFWTCTT